MSYRAWTIAALAVAVALGGCTPGWYRRDADSSAYDVISKAQVATFGRNEPFSVDSPGEALRTRLLLDQNLPHSSPVSLGTPYLEQVGHWPEKNYPPPGEDQFVGPPWHGDKPLVIGLTEALQIAARNSRDYQSRKEDVFRAALALDLESNQFRSLLYGDARSTYTEDLSGDDPVRGVVNSGSLSWDKKLKTGAALSAEFAIDLVKLLTADRSSSMGLYADATITVPLLRGAGRYVVTEPLTQAERDLAYSLYTFARYKRTLAVRVASEYLSVLQQLDQVANTEDSYRRLIAATRRVSAMADEGRLPPIQLDQARQDELRARDRWVSALQSYARRLDTFKITLGLPADAKIDLDRNELVRLAKISGLEQASAAATQPSQPTTQPSQPTTQPSQPTTRPADGEEVKLVEPTREGGGPLEMASDKAIMIALTNRLDLRLAIGQVFDAQRGVVVAADALKAGLTLTGTARAGASRGLGSAGSPDARIDPEHGVYTASLLLDLPLERTAERNAYRNSYISLERAVRNAQDLEDQVKLQVRDALRNLLSAREGYAIQAQAVVVAKRRVDSTDLFLELGRAEVRDVLEAQEALVSAQNALTAAAVSYRVAELELQRDMGVLEVDEKGNWREYQPDTINN